MPIAPEFLAQRVVLVKKYGRDVTEYSAQGHAMWDLLAGKHFRHIIEIGTYRGMTAALLAQFADRVTTIDVKPWTLVDSVLDAFQVTGRVRRIIVKDDVEKARIIRELDFDMAYIDGDHSRGGATIDFILTRRCGHLLFHDYDSPPCRPVGMEGPRFLLDEIQPEGKVVRVPPFAWWFEG